MKLVTCMLLLVGLIGLVGLGGCHGGYVRHERTITVYEPAPPVRYYRPVPPPAVIVVPRDRYWDGYSGRYVPGPPPPPPPYYRR